MKIFDPDEVKLELMRLDDLDDGEFTAPMPDEDEEDDEVDVDEAAGDKGID